MTNIHHATAKRAAQFGIALSDLGDSVEATHTESGRRVANESAKVALNLAILTARFAKEYPSIEVGYDAPSVFHTDPDGEETVLVDFEAKDFDIDAVFAEALENYSEQGLEGVDAEAAGDEEEATGKIVVPAKYKAKYAEEGHPTHCGDWLAEQLHGRFESEGVFDLVKFDQFLDANEVSRSGKWAQLPGSGQRGWQGRYRMNARQVLEKLVALRGWVILNIDSERTPVPTSDLEILRTKHAKWIEKETKRNAEATAGLISG